MDDGAAPLFRQIAGLLEDAIVDGSLGAGERAPSTNELAAFHSINPATARKGLQLLSEQRILEKRRGLGMFVTEEAKDVILRRRREEFAAAYLAPLIDEAVKLDVTKAELHTLIDKVADSRGLYK